MMGKLSALLKNNYGIKLEQRVSKSLFSEVVSCNQVPSVLSNWPEDIAIKQRLPPVTTKAAPVHTQTH